MSTSVAVHQGCTFNKNLLERSSSKTSASLNGSDIFHRGTLTIYSHSRVLSLHGSRSGNSSTIKFLACKMDNWEDFTF